MPFPVLGPYSRYAGTDVRLDGGVLNFGEWRPPALDAEGEQLYVVADADVNRPDLVAFRFYGDAALWWVPLLHNGIQDPFTVEAGDHLRMPSLETVRRGLAALEPRDFTAAAAAGGEASRVLSRPLLAMPYVPPAYRSPYLDDAVAAPDPAPAAVPFFNYAFPVPPGTGYAHFQLQVSESPGFTPVLVSKMSAVSQRRWYVYDPAFNSGAGGFRAFPAGGIQPAALEGQTVYFQFNATDNLVRSQLYYVRHRAVVDETEQDWTAAPPVVIPAA